MKKKILSGILALSLVSSLSAGLFTAEAAMLEYESVTKSHIMDFEGVTFSDGTTEIEGTDTVVRKHIVVNGKAYVSVYVKGAGNKAEIVTDSVSGSTALKLTYKGTDDIVVNNLFNGWNTDSYPNLLTGTPTVHSTASVRLEKHASNARISKFGRFESNGSKLGDPQIYNGYIYTEVNANGASLVPVSEFTDKYYEFSEIYNSSTKTAGYVTSAGVEKTTVTTDTRKPSDAKFQITTKDTTSTAYNGTETDGETILWLDNLGYEIIDFKAEEIRIGGVNDPVTVEKTGTISDAPINAPIELKFNQGVSAASVTSDNIYVTDNTTNEKITAELVQESDNKIYVYPKGQIGGRQYTLTVKAGIASKEKTVITTATDKTCSYTTRNDGVEFKGYIVDTDFDGTYANTSTKDANGIVDGNFKYLAQHTTDSMAVVEDGEDNKALKLTRGQGAGTNSTIYNYELPESKTTGKLVVSFDLKVKTISAAVESFMSFGRSTDQNGYCADWRSNIHQNQYYWLDPNSEGTTLANNWGYFESNLDMNSYFPVMMSVDLDNKKYLGETFRNYATSPGFQQKSKTWTAEDYDVKYFNLANFSSASSSKEGEYYIDNFKIAYYDKKRLDADSIDIGTANVDATKDTINITMNDLVTDADVTKENFMLKDSGGESPDYTVSRKDNVVTLTLTEDMKYDTVYTLTVKKGITSQTAGIEPMLNDYTHTFRTAIKTVYMADFGNLTDLMNNGEGKTYTATGADHAITSEKLVGTLSYSQYTQGNKVEYAYDEEEKRWGFKLTHIAGDTSQFNFLYNFPAALENGKYIVRAEVKNVNHSKALSGWPTIQDGEGKDIEKIFIRNNRDAWINGYNSTGKNTGATYTKGVHTMLAEISTGKSIYMGMDDVELKTTTVDYQAKTPSVKGVIFKSYGSTDNISKFTGPDTGDNVTWIYSISVEKKELKVSKTSFDTAATTYDPETPLTLTFNEAITADTAKTSNIQLYKGEDLITEYEYKLEQSADGKTVTLVPVAGLEYDRDYKVVVKAGVAPTDTNVPALASNITLAFKTKAYESLATPDIIWSTVPNGAEYIDYKTKEITLSTDGVLLNSDTVTSSNVKVYENNQEFAAYTVTPFNNSHVKVEFTNGLNKLKSYKITVTGLKDISGKAMTANYTLEFTTNDDIYASSAKSTISADGTKSVISARLHNNTSDSISYTTIAVLRNNNDEILGVSLGSSGTLTGNNAQDVKVEVAKDSNAAKFQLYIWNSLENIKPLTGKIEQQPIAERTYGYDNYKDETKPLTVSFIGGSITQQGQYTAPLISKIKSHFTGRDVTAVVDGIGGTGSGLGVYRLDKDVIAVNPDIVFIEFAVNDCNAEATKTTMEAMIRKLMELPHQPMVVMLDLSTKEEDFDAIEAWQDLREKYGVAHVNVAQYIKENTASATNTDGLYVWTKAEKEAYPGATALTETDGTHPNADGGKVYADYIWGTISGNFDNYFKKMTYVENPVTDSTYAKATMYSWKDAIYSTGWSVGSTGHFAYGDGLLTAKNDGATVTFKFVGTEIGFYLPRHSGAPGATYSIDGGEAKSFAPSAGQVTPMPMGYGVASGLEDKEHTITITADKGFQFGYFMVR